MAEEVKQRVQDTEQRYYYREIATKTGQQLQIYSILGRMTPEGMLRYAAKELETMKRRLAENPNRWGTWLKNNGDKLRLTAEDAEKITAYMERAQAMPDGRDKAIGKKTGVRTLGAPNYKDQAKGWKKGAFESYDDFRRAINTRDIQANRFEVSNKLGSGPAFKGNKPMSKALEFLNRTTGVFGAAGQYPCLCGGEVRV